MVGFLIRRRLRPIFSLPAALDDVGEPSALGAANRPRPIGADAFGHPRRGSARPLARHRIAPHRLAPRSESSDCAVGPAPR